MTVFLAGIRHDTSIGFGPDTDAPTRLVILDGETSTPTISTSLAKRVLPKGGIAVLTRLDNLEDTVAALAAVGFTQVRFLRTEDHAPNTDWFANPEPNTYTVLGTRKTGGIVFQERYHTGRLNDQPNDPRPQEPALGGVARTTVAPQGLQARVRLTLSELISIHSAPGETVVVDAQFAPLLPTELEVLHRTRPPKPPASPQTQARQAARKAAQAQPEGDAP